VSLSWGSRAHLLTLRCGCCFFRCVSSLSSSSSPSLFDVVVVVDGGAFGFVAPPSDQDRHRVPQRAGRGGQAEDPPSLPVRVVLVWLAGWLAGGLLLLLLLRAHSCFCAKAGNFPAGRRWHRVLADRGRRTAAGKGRQGQARAGKGRQGQAGWLAGGRAGWLAGLQAYLLNYL
jgi:hypothetical protein